MNPKTDECGKVKFLVKRLSSVGLNMINKRETIMMMMTMM